MIEREGILVTFGVSAIELAPINVKCALQEEDALRYPLLKIWDLEKPDPKTGATNLLRATKVQPSNRPHPVRALYQRRSSSSSHFT